MSIDPRSLMNDPAAFRSALLIDSDGGPRALSECMDPWQAADFSALDPGWRRVAGFDCDGFQRAWIERGRGHSKTSDLAVAVTWCLLAGRRQLSGIAAAADRDQARLLRDAISRLVSLNSWLATIIDIQSFKVVNTRTGSTLDIISSDLGSSYGILVDFVCLDEITNWPRRELWDSLISAAAKRSHCMVVVITNSGNTDSWQHQTREVVRLDPSWYFSRIEGPRASWITPERLEEQRRLLPHIAYQRLWLNQWTSGSGDAVDPSDLAAAITAEGPLETYEEKWGPYIASLDIGLTNDFSSLCVIGCGVSQRRMRLARTWSWDPRQYGGRVPLHRVKETCLEAARTYQLCGCVVDPWQAAYLCEQLSEQGLPMFMFPWTAPNKAIMALTLVESFRERLIEIYDHPELLSELSRVSIVEKMGRYSITAPRDERGHCDTAMSFIQGLVWARGTRSELRGELPPTEQPVVEGLFSSISQ